MRKPDQATLRRGLMLVGLYVLSVAVALSLSAALIAVTGGAAADDGVGAPMLGSSMSAMRLCF